MDTVLRAAAVCVLAALAALLLKKGSPELGIAVTLAAAAAVFLALAGEFAKLLEFFHSVADAGGLRTELLSPLYKTVGIALVVRIGGNLCRDAGESALAAVMETAGSVCALLAALPLMQTVLSTLTELMKG